jgi:hypothetical protein
MLKNALLVLGSMAVLLGAANAVSAGPGGIAASDAYAYAGGAGWIITEAGPIQLEISADLRTDGVDGQMSWKAASGRKVRAAVTCLEVDGTEATLTGIIHSPKAIAGQPVVMKLYDGDEDGAADAAAVAVGAQIHPWGQDVVCATTDLAPSPLTQGNLVVWGPW